MAEGHLAVGHRVDDEIPRSLNPRSSTERSPVSSSATSTLTAGLRSGDPLCTGTT